VFSTVLIANRGEIAVRIARACADSSLRSVAVYTPEDRDAMHVRVADEAFALDGESPSSAYLNPQAILAAAARSGADAIHPGYGFLSESPALASATTSAGLVWIGPPADVLAQVSNKVSARALASTAGVPLVPASYEALTGAGDIIEFAASCGYPVVIKAIYGGGGRGMRVIHRPEDAEESLAACQREAAAAFGRAECFVEKYLIRPRHIETQCLADNEGTVAVISTRDCTIQRRHQKLIEEAPAPFLSKTQEGQLKAASRAILRAANYRGAATCEFLLSPAGEIYFLEINPRLQVEHPVTEEVTGIDLVREQLRIAIGEPLGYTDVLAYGHAIEFRINAEDASAGFLPSPGILHGLRLPGGPGVRCDFGYEDGDALTGAFDSMIGKVIVRGRDRSQALARARRALRELKVEGVAYLRDFHRAVVASEAFAAPTASGFKVHTGWVAEDFADTIAALPASAASNTATVDSAATSRVVVEVGGKRLEVVLPTVLTAIGTAQSQGPLPVPRRPAKRSAVSGPSNAASSGSMSDAAVSAPMRGTVVRVAVSEGETVAAGDLLVVLEAMKMEQPLVAPRDGLVRSVAVAAGDQVPAGQILCVVEPPAPTAT
jgi:acetyl-CoA/propionyl-CoA carboxylase biotin carboxyl carrier protein